MRGHLGDLAGPAVASHASATRPTEAPPATRPRGDAHKPRFAIKESVAVCRPAGDLAEGLALTRALGDLAEGLQPLGDQAAAGDAGADRARSPSGCRPSTRSPTDGAPPSREREFDHVPRFTTIVLGAVGPPADFLASAVALTVLAGLLTGLVIVAVILARSGGRRERPGGRPAEPCTKSGPRVAELPAIAGAPLIPDSEIMLDTNEKGPGNKPGPPRP